MRIQMMFIAVLFPLLAFAQNTWETENVKQEEQEKQEAAAVNPDQKYLVGAVPVVDGKVTFTASFKTSGKTVRQIYNIVGRTMSNITKEDNQLEGSRIVYSDTTKNEIAADIQEWLVFKSNAISLDRTRFHYNIIANIYEGGATIKITHITYNYDEERSPQRYTAEEWITDEYGLRSKGQKLARISGKFRRKTIDRKDYIFNLFEKELAK